MEDVRAEAVEVETTYVEQRVSLLRLAFLLTGSHERAEDVVQTAFVAAQSRWADIDNPVGYLRRVVVNQAKDGQRRQFRRADAVAHQDPITHQPELDETWLELRRLPARQRTVVVLRFYEDMSLVDIARLLERPAGTVRSDLHRALDHLRRTLR